MTGTIVPLFCTFWNFPPNCLSLARNINCMEVLHKIPLTFDERIPYGPELRIPASWDEFLEMLEECEYRIEYDEGEIISFMGYATENHEILALRIGSLLDQLLMQGDYRVHGSNLALHIPGFVRKYYNADCVVVKGPTENIPLRGQMSAVANPILLVEVLSPNTRDFDLSRKLKNYQKIPSLQQLLFIESTERKVTVYSRSTDWAPEVISGPDAAVPVLEEGVIALSDLYRKVEFVH